jgi:hypothetical protein
MSTPPNTPPINPPETEPTPTQPPQDFGNIEFNATNLIGQGATNQIINSRRSSILNGTLNTIDGLYNTHIIGDFVTAQEDNKFYVGCPNGMWVGGRVSATSYSSIYCDSNIFAEGSVAAEGDITAANLSDKRLKDNISLIDNPLSKIMSLDAIEFNWNDKQSTHQGHDIGLIAQQVEKIAPEIVKERSNGYKALKYEKVIPLLVGAIQEQEEKIQILNERVEYLLEKINSMS